MRCLRERATGAPAAGTEPERVPAARLARLGCRLSVTLDRVRRKRRGFLVLEKPRKDGGVYEQGAFCTGAAVRARQCSECAELSQPVAAGMRIVIDGMERCAWTFPGAEVSKHGLPVGDCALRHDAHPHAIVERKALPNLLGGLAELAAWPHAELAIEAPYADFGNPARTGQWPAHLLRVRGALPVLGPAVQCVFAGNRKLANAWIQDWFAAVQAAIPQPRLPQVAAGTLAVARGGMNAGVHRLIMSC